MLSHIAKFPIVIYFVGVMLFSPAAFSKEVYIPPELQPWKEWVLQDHGQIRCPFLYNEANYSCVWPSSLAFDVKAHSARFELEVSAFQEGWINLPGSNRYWPQKVMLNDKPVNVREVNEKPQIYVSAGTYHVRGEIEWQSMPRKLPLPAATGLLSVRVNGESIHAPIVDEQHQLWLGREQKTQKVQEQDALDIQVYRHLKDDVPLMQTTRIHLNVSGGEREIILGRALLDGFKPMELSSPLPARIEKDGSMRIQVKPGFWEVTLSARAQKKMETFSIEAMTDNWPEQELWVFQANPQLHMVRISGADTVDPQRTQLPEQWKNLPAYILDKETVLQVEEQYRGNTSPSANKLSLTKDMWLGFDGKQFTVKDEIAGEVHRHWRINAEPEYELGRVTLNGEPQMISRIAEGGLQGFEIRRTDIQADVISNLKRTSVMPSTGWQEDFDRVRTVLHLPPGWSLFHVSGADSVSDSWISKWSLWDIFLLLIITVSASRVGSKLLGAVALVTLLFTYHRYGAPLFIWLNIIAVMALLPVVSGKFKTWLERYQMVSFVILAIMLVPFSVDYLRQAVYVQLEQPNQSMWSYGHSSNTLVEEYALNQAVEADMLAEEEVLVSSRMPVSKMKSWAPSAPIEKKRYDSNQIIQTGPGVPKWRWREAYLNWSGPVKPGETVGLTLVPPVLNRLGHVISVLFCMGFAVLLFARSFPGIALPKWLLLSRANALPMALLMIPAMFTPQPADAEVAIDSEILSALEQRLTRSAECLPQCASIEKAKVEADNDQLAIRVHYHALADIAVPLPLQGRSWSPKNITDNGKPAKLQQNEQGIWLIQLDKGRHLVDVVGDVRHLDSLNLRFHLNVHNLATEIAHWQVTGFEQGVLKGNTLLMQRVNPSVEQAREKMLPDPMPVFVMIERELQLDMDWHVVTRVRRVTPVNGAINLRVPMMAGESPINELAVRENQVEVNFSPNQQVVQWRSLLSKTDTLQLTAAEGDSWVEVWRLSSSSQWHTEFSGIPVLTQEQGARPVWRPWPGEQLTIHVSQPKAVEGKQLTIESMEAQYNLGRRSNTADVSLSVRSSKGGELPFALPEGATLQSLTVNGRVQPLPKQETEIKIPIQPGQQNVQLRWQASEGISTLVTTPLLHLEQHIHNATLKIQLPRDRWPLLVGGPAMGPAVLLWGVLFVVIAVAVGLGRVQGMPLKTYEWVLLGIGMGTANVYAPLIVVVWLLLLTKRGGITHLPEAGYYKLMQIGLFGLSALALIALLGTVPHGLLSSPNMHIVGNDSTAYALQWYQDVALDQLPTAWVFSLPMWAYRLAMLLWSLWLAFALMKWIKWAWTQLSYQGIWPTTEKKQKPEGENTSKDEVKES
ncbi:hypothetical protein [Teredinibacter sp. KSP-S5-2]|uniref:hypothetical protein n=1 Tax=Teredinibacter sp. KSP-S5-2 TaxID=3034506 RepID=UPI0029341C64|nr:hypothetical protein [Teredinibacter sp. KSP-S5-2]WNO11035.1 hypothetical protein P5V12_07590 [Teredinibacter sp. KSP-S5-2]